MLIREQIELALEATKRRLSPLTHFVHCPKLAADEATGFTEAISLVDNFHYVLLLFRSRTVENIQEGKRLLAQLLAYQAPNGNFCAFMHDFPDCKDRFVAAHIGLAQRWLLKEFGSALGEMKEPLAQSLKQACLHLQAEHESKPGNNVVEALISACCGKDFDFDAECDAWYRPHELGQLLSALVLQHPEDPLAQTPELRVFLEKTWHATQKVYCGPAAFELTIGTKQEATTYHYFLGRAVDTDDAAALSTALVRGSLGIQGQEGLVAVTLPDVRLANRGAYGYKLTFAEKHILAFDGKTLSYEAESESDSMDHAVYIGRAPDVAIFVNGKKASLFSLGDVVEVRTDHGSCQLNWQLLEGSGVFTGHILHGNRSGQHKWTDNERYTTFDWCIHMRTVRLDSPCKLSICLTPLP